MFAGKKSAQIREILISESAWEEMTCLFAPSLDDAVNIAERIRNTISAAKFPHKGSPISAYLTASFGVAQWTTRDSLETLTEKADKELYKAKQAGRNRVSFSR
ncbi:diguanylate cyclase [Kluyvera georgiana]|nr:diguanylate cyclase [Kluyvera georgiana]MDA8496240.1 diguanylate cyclase [Kluyvera georgiana]